MRGELSGEIAVIVLCDHPIVFRVFRDNHVSSSVSETSVAVPTLFYTVISILLPFETVVQKRNSYQCNSEPFGEASSDSEESRTSCHEDEILRLSPQTWQHSLFTGEGIGIAI